MTTQSFINRLSSLVGSSVCLKGWISNVRSSGKIHFIELRDGTGFIQCVAEEKNLADEKSKAVLVELTHESSVELEGNVSAHPKKPGVVELHVTAITLVHKAIDYPIGRKEHGPDFLLDNRHLWLRSKKQWAIQRIRNTIINATYEYFERENFIKIDSPVITANACEGTTTLFEFEYFDLGMGYLSQSGQLYLEAAIASHGRVFDFGPVFRAEKSKTKKHLTEFWMMDAEMAFVNHQENMAIQENLIAHVVAKVLEKNREELVILERNIAALEKVKAPFPKVTHKEVVAILRELGSEITEDMDLGAGDEALLAQKFDVPMFIEKWPTKIKAFYMKRDPNNPNVVLSADLMAPEGFGELIGGSQREDDHDKLLERMHEENIPVDKFGWYLDTRKYGSVTHSGFGYGLERLVCWISGAPHIRETIPFPRMIYRFTP
jgi:asparaginyl-tRNA synthetase